MPSLKPSSDIRTFFARTAENQRNKLLRKSGEREQNLKFKYIM